MHIQQLAAGEVLAHQHAEGGRRLRVFKGFLGQADPGGTAAGRQQQRVGVRAGAQGNDQLIAGRFKQFCDLGVGQNGFQFPGRQFQCRGIQCHVCYLVLIIKMASAFALAIFSGMFFFNYNRSSLRAAPIAFSRKGPLRKATALPYYK